MRRLLLDTGGYLQRAMLPDGDGAALRRLAESRRRLAEAGCGVPAIETTVRYRWARATLDGVVTQPGRFEVTATDRIDRVLTHRLWGIAVFALLMLLVFQAVFVGAQPLTDAIERASDRLGGWVTAAMSEGPLRSLLVDGVISGVGSVLKFLPQILILFFFIAVLEDCGYMARAACLMDRLMVRVGLSGRSFIPMLSSFACAVPGIMATRVIENDRDRLTTILVAPLVTCSARLQVYALLIGAFIPAQKYLGGWLGLQGLTLAGFYALGIVAAVVAALVLKRTLLRGPSPPFLMELPGYQWPSPRTVLARMLQRGWVFLRSAGTLILAISIIVWAALYYPHDPRGDQRHSAAGAAGPGDRAGRAAAGLGLADRLRGAGLVPGTRSGPGHARRHVQPGRQDRPRVGRRAEPPSASIALRHLGAERPAGLHRAGGPVDHGLFRPSAQCAATLAVIRRETNSWRWPAFAFGYMTVLAYVGALLTYQVGTWWGG